MNNNEKWTEIISPTTNLFKLNLKEVWNYRDLLYMFVKRDFVSNYKQTILGPLWFFIQPILTTATYIIIFGNIAKLSTDGLPMVLFYMSGITLWNYFSECLNKTATVFKDNANIFGKVYFPRLIMPLSIIVSNLIRFGIQFILFLICWLWFYFKSANIHPNYTIIFVPYLILLMALLALGLGMLISALTTKYRDLVFLMTFCIQLLMYATPVIYPLSSLPVKYSILINVNPLTPIFEAFRYAFTGSGNFTISGLVFSSIYIFIILFIGTVVFNKVEKSFMDTV